MAVLEKNVLKKNGVSIRFIPYCFQMTGKLHFSVIENEKNILSNFKQCIFSQKKTFFERNFFALGDKHETGAPLLIIFVFKIIFVWYRNQILKIYFVF